MKLNADVIDEACEEIFGHKNWGYADLLTPEQLETAHTTIVFFHEPDENEDSDEN